MSKTTSTRRPELRSGDAVNALLAVALAGLAYWQGEVGLQAVRDHLTKVHGDVGALQREMSAMRQDNRQAAQTTRRIDGTTRNLLKAQQSKERSGDPPVRWSW
jgi:hypothetical protein